LRIGDLDLDLDLAVAGLVTNLPRGNTDADEALAKMTIRSYSVNTNTISELSMSYITNTV